MRRKLVLSLVFLSLIMINCQNTEQKTIQKHKSKTTKSDSIKVVTRHFNNNPKSRIEWKIPVVKNKDGKYIRNGTATRFTVTGKVAESITYEMDKKVGKRLSYYPNGKVYLEQTYKNGKLNGECKMFNRQGNVIAKYNYLNDMPGMGLVECTSSGKIKPDPVLSIKAQDDLKLTGKYILNFSLTGEGTDRVKSVKYYQGKLYKEKYLRYKSLMPATKNYNKKGEIVFDLPPNSEFNHTINIVAVAKTYSGLKLILQRPVSVHICKL